MEITTNNDKIISVSFVDVIPPLSGRTSPVLEEVIVQLDEYFAGKRKGFDLPLEIKGTEFQRFVWCELMKITYDTTISYSQLAEKAGDIKAVRAVANAVAANKLAVIIPCHRVIGKDGSLTGYRWGIGRKKWLLEHERR